MSAASWPVAFVVGALPPFVGWEAFARRQVTRLPRVRMHERLDELYAIGDGPGANRPHPSAGEDEAHELAADWLREAGLEVEVDPGGNLLGRSSRSTDVWVGSHLDTVPHGGRFDGALGVVAAVEAVEHAGCGSVVVFRGEEVGCVGSRALVGRGTSLPRAFLELHVEQGPVLADLDAPLGVVSSISGLTRGEQIFEGHSGHAGTTPMELRDDALLRAAAAILRISSVAREIDGAVATVGQVEVEPGGVNVIPGRVRISIDARAPDADGLTALVRAIGFEPGYRTEPVELSELCREAFRVEIAALGLPVVELPSGGGHDAGILAAAGVDAGLLFVRSLNGGLSHTPDELSSPEDIELAADVLTAALRRVASSL